MAHEHGSRHGADAAGDGSDGLHHRLCLAKADVTAEFAFLVDMDAHIHDDLTGPQMLCADEAHPAHGHHHNIGLTADFQQVLGAGVAEGDGGVFPVQHHGCGLAHHEAAAHDDGPPAGEGNVVEFQNFKTGLRRAGRVADGSVGEDTGQRAVGDAVNVLFGRERGADGPVIKLFGQGAEEQTAVDGGVCVDAGNDAQQLFLRSVGGQKELLHLDAHLRTAGHDAFLVGEVIGARTHPHDGQRGDNALFPQCGAAGGICFVHGGHDGRALQDGRHIRSLSLHQARRRLATDW